MRVDEWVVLRPMCLCECLHVQWAMWCDLPGLRGWLVYHCHSCLLMVWYPYRRSSHWAEVEGTAQVLCVSVAASLSSLVTATLMGPCHTHITPHTARTTVSLETMNTHTHPFSPVCSVFVSQVSHDLQCVCIRGITWLSHDGLLQSWLVAGGGPDPAGLVESTLAPPTYYHPTSVP